MADGWRLAICDACHQTNYVNPLALAVGEDLGQSGMGWCQYCRKDQPHVLVNNSTAAPVS